MLVKGGPGDCHQWTPFHWEFLFFLYWIIINITIASLSQNFHWHIRTNSPVSINSLINNQEEDNGLIIRLSLAYKRLSIMIKQVIHYLWTKPHPICDHGGYNIKVKGYIWQKLKDLIRAHFKIRYLSIDLPSSADLGVFQECLCTIKSKSS